MQLSYFNRIKGEPGMPVDDTITVQSWIELMKTGGKFKSLIEEARTVGKGSEKYNSIKKTELPCICWNFNFKGFKLNSCINEPTGFLYIDIDHPCFEIGDIDTSKIFCFFKSLSNKGYGLVVKVKGLTTENIKPATYWIASQIGLKSEFIDPKAIKSSQFNVLTYSPEIKTNWSCPEFDLGIMPNSTQTEKRCNSLTNTLTTTHRICSELHLFQIRHKDASDYADPNKDYTVFSEKKPTIELWFPKPGSIPQGRRNYVINGLFASMMAINPGIPQANAYRWLKQINEVFCAEPLKTQEIDRIFQNIWNNLDNDKIKKRKKRRIIFNSNSKLTIEEKRSIIPKEIGKIRSDATKKKIYDFIEQYAGDKKITAKFVAENIGMSLDTVKRYWPEFKDLAKSINQSR